MRILFLGTGDIALPTFEWLLASDQEIVGLVTQPDRPVGRKQVMTPPRVKVLAEEAGLPVFQPEDLRDPGTWEGLPEADVFVVMAYGQILKRAFIELPRVACINLHASLLPRWRGASCIQAAIREGDESTGVTAMYVVRKLDAGNIIVKDELPIGSKETGGELHDRLAVLAPQTLEKALQHICEEKAVGQKQDEDFVTYAPKLGRQDGVIDWSLSARQIERLVRANDPWPGTSSTFLDGKGRKRMVKIFPPLEVWNEEERKGEPGALIDSEGDDLLVACGSGILKIEEVQPEGSRRMSAQEFLLGAGSAVEVFGQ